MRNTNKVTCGRSAQIKIPPDLPPTGLLLFVLSAYKIQTTHKLVSFNENLQRISLFSDESQTKTCRIQQKNNRYHSDNTICPFRYSHLSFGKLIQPK